ncbi:GAF and ANTAR domain-containing protein [Pseudokineococcus sp. 5B2Z-1]|uniref:GAF and ANTAR domain-containing protein n=1 Tax=Pseudokineococcus sp. 5B2Z-1 TaxID=3132744 RepID=UPI0030A1C4F1
MTGRGRPSPQNTGSVAGQQDLAVRLAEMAHDLQDAHEPPDVMTRVVSAALALVPGAEEGSVSLVQGRRRITSEGVSSELPRLFDLLQMETNQGPCLDSAFDHLTVRVDDLAADERWPVLGRRAADAGLRSALCLQLFVQGDDLGALNLVSRRPHAFGDESEQVGLLLASHAAIAVADALQLQGVRRALANRDLIGQAKGILMGRHRVTADQAFEMLVRASQDSNRELVDVAQALTATGDVDG